MGSKLVYFVIQRGSDTSGVAVMKQTEIAGALGMTDRNVRLCILALRRKQLIRWQRASKARRPNRYQLLRRPKMATKGNKNV